MDVLRRDFLKYCAGSAAALGLEMWPQKALRKAFAAGKNPLLVTPTYPIVTPYTTLQWIVTPTPPPALPADTTLYPCRLEFYKMYGYGDWTLAKGLPYLRPAMATGVVGGHTFTPTGTLLLTFFSISDVHLCDKESPARSLYYGYTYPSVTTNTPEPGGKPLGSLPMYSGIILSTTQVLDAAVQTINALHKQTPFDFGMALGDACDNTQYNELRWYIDILDGKEITPSSGYQGGTDIIYQKPFQPAGLDKSIKWYQAIGNHDQFWMGAAKVDDYIKKTLIGSNVLNIGIIRKMPPTAAEMTAVLSGRGYYMGVIDGSTEYGEVIYAGPQGEFSNPPQVIADPDRYSLSMKEWMNEFFTTTSEPVGHGFTREMVSNEFACYSFYPKENVPIKIIVVDDTDRYGCAAFGAMDEERYTWLKQELKDGQDSDELMIICAHIPLNPYTTAAMTEPPPYSDTKAYLTQLWPYPMKDNPTVNPISAKQLIATLHEYPNFVLWVAGHVHRNTITPQPAYPNAKPTDSEYEFGYWEVETPSLRDYPQQLRHFQIRINSDDNISIFALDVDTAVNPVILENGSNMPAYTSRSYAVGGQQIFQAEALPSNPANNVQQGPNMDPASGVYNAELVIQMNQVSPGLRKKLLALKKT
jgi:metallophosphoesterase (TIGR03768 family)